MTTIANTTINHYTPIKMRHELKHVISGTEDFILTSRLKKLFPHDEHADSHGSYRVSSLYFDTPYDQALREKLNGVNYREKFRLRYYNQAQTLIKLEKKIKVNGLCGKRSVTLAREQIVQLLDGKYEFLAASDHPLLLEFYSKLQGQLLRPKTFVCYDREAFLYSPGNVRITLDRNLRTALNPLDFLAEQPGFLHMADEGTVLEVKYDQFIPEIVQMAVQVPGTRTAAFSKYAVCRRID